MSSPQLIVEPIGLDADTLPHPIVWKNLFGNVNPVEIEIGIGKGTFLTDRAKANPQVNFLGLEYARWYWRFASDRLRRNGCTNARTVRAEAGYFFREFVPEATVSVVHIYFPDPWPKKRHHKRRLMQPAFVARLAGVLASGGLLRCATDWRPYALEMLEILGAAAGLTNLAADGGFVARPTERPPTRFERRGERLGHEVWDLAFRRGPC
jgi:tRNA (guanine-N7-)-methyltransferase